MTEPDPAATQGVVVGVDVGGTKVLAAVVAPDGQILRSARTSTPGRRVEVELVERALVEAVTQAAQGEKLRAVGVGAAGFVDSAGERVVFAPHLPWRGEPVRDRLADLLGAPVVLDNDANCAAYAEARFGAARGAASAVIVNLGTGIGGGLVLDGRLVRGHTGMAGEFGHMQVVPDGAPCECGRTGCWEQYSSGNALVRYVRSRWGQAPTLLDEASGGDPAVLTGPMITTAAGHGDLLSLEAFRAVGDWLGVGIANLVAAFDPEVVVVGGGVSAAGDRLLTPARAALRRALVGGSVRVPPPVLAARLGPDAGAVGAATLAHDHLTRPIVDP